MIYLLETASGLYQDPISSTSGKPLDCKNNQFSNKFHSNWLNEKPNKKLLIQDLRSIKVQNCKLIQQQKVSREKTMISRQDVLIAMKY